MYQYFFGFFLFEYIMFVTDVSAEFTVKFEIGFTAAIDSLEKYKYSRKIRGLFHHAFLAKNCSTLYSQYK